LPILFGWLYGKLADCWVGTLCNDCVTISPKGWAVGGGADSPDLLLTEKNCGEMVVQFFGAV
jgi:hypothetical protein